MEVRLRSNLDKTNKQIRNVFVSSCPLLYMCSKMKRTREKKFYFFFSVVVENPANKQCEVYEFTK